MTRFSVPAGVHATAQSDGQLVLLNQSTGRWHLLNRTGADLYDELRRTSDLDNAVGALAERHVGVPPDQLRGDVERLIADLVRRGLLEFADEIERRPEASLMTLPMHRVTAPRRHRILAGVAFLLALVLLRLPFRLATSAVTRLKTRLTGRDATIQEASRILAAARYATWHYPGRVACLELSLTAVLTAVLLRSRIDWCFGFSADPRTLHAWIEVAGEPVVEPGGDPITQNYQRVFHV